MKRIQSEHKKHYEKEMEKQENILQMSIEREKKKSEEARKKIHSR